MIKLLLITDSYGTHRFKVTKETPDYIETDFRTIIEGQPVRFNKREDRMEYYNGRIWDVYISDSSIIQVDVVADAAQHGNHPQVKAPKKANMSKYKPTRSSRLCSLCRLHAKQHGVETTYSERCSSNGKCVVCGCPHTYEKHWHSRAFFRDFPIPESQKYVPRRRKTEFE